MLAAAILLVVCLLNFTQVGGRYALGTSLSWAEETMRYIMVWLMMLGSVTAVYRAEHMAVEGFQDIEGTQNIVEQHARAAEKNLIQRMRQSNR